MTRLTNLALCLGATCALCVAAIPAARANLLINGGFETESGTSTLLPTGWTLGGSGSAVDSTFAHSGTYDVSFSVGPNANSPGTLSQTIATPGGQDYTLSFWLLDENLVVGNEVFTVNFGAFSTSYSGGSLTGGSYTNLVVTIPASDVTTLTTTLSFTGVQDPNTTSAVFNLDDVSLTANGAAVPEPSAAAVLGAALGLTALFAARRRHPGRS